jgi:D-methionine transport system ATP-binding protein
MILKTNVVVNIIEANLNTKDGKAYGEMLIQLPDDETSIAKVKNYLNSEAIEYEEKVIDDKVVSC